MKKFAALVLIVVTAGCLCACQTFHNRESVTQSGPTTVNIILKPNATNFDPAALTDLVATIRQNIAAAENPSDTTLSDTTNTPEINTAVPKITAVKDPQAVDGLYLLELTLADVPATEITVITKPWYLWRTVTIYNPLSLLPETDALTPFVTHNCARRHTKANTELYTKELDGSYTYLWAENTPLVLQDKFANPPLYYFVALGVAAITGVVVYLVTRYFGCKSPKK